MSDILNDSYQQLEKLFKEHNLDCSVSELHGMVIGYLISDGDCCYKTWSGLVSEDLDIVSLPEQCSDQIKQLFLYSHIQLSSPEISVDIFLPDLHNGLLTQVHGLADFSRGFLYGFGVSQNSVKLIENQLIHEILKEMTCFSQVDVQNLDDQNNGQALAEIIDYIQSNLYHWKQLCLESCDEKLQSKVVN